MGIIVDTCVFIHTEKNGTLANFVQLGHEEIYISSITASELLVGVHHANTAERKLKRTTFVEIILNNIPILDFTLDVARIHSEIYTNLSKKGIAIGSHDLIISATALSNNFTLLTNNIKDFKHVPKLKLENFSFS